MADREDVEVKVRVSVEGEDPKKLKRDLEELEKQNKKTASSGQPSSADANRAEQATKREVEQNKKLAESYDEVAAAKERASKSGPPRGPDGRFVKREAAAPPEPASRPGGASPSATPQRPATPAPAPSTRTLRRPDKTGPTDPNHPSYDPLEDPTLTATEALQRLRDTAQQAKDAKPIDPASRLHDPETGEGRRARAPRPSAPVPNINPESPTLAEGSPFFSAVLEESREQDRAQEQAHHLSPDSPTVIESTPHASAVTGNKHEPAFIEDWPPQSELDALSALEVRAGELSPADFVRSIEQSVIEALGSNQPGNYDDKQLKKDVHDRLIEVKETLGEHFDSVFDAYEEEFDPDRRAARHRPTGFRGVLDRLGEYATTRGNRIRPTTATGMFAQQAWRAGGSMLSGAAAGGAGIGGMVGGAAAAAGPLAIAGVAAYGIYKLGGAIKELAGEVNAADKEFRRVIGAGQRGEVRSQGAAMGNRATRETQQFYSDLSIGLQGQGLSAQQANRYAMMAGSSVMSGVATGRSGEEMQSAVAQYIGGGDPSGLQRVGLEVSQGDVDFAAINQGFTTVETAATRTALALGVLEDAARDAADDGGESTTPVWDGLKGGIRRSWEDTVGALGQSGRWLLEGGANLLNRITPYELDPRAIRDEANQQGNFYRTERGNIVDARDMPSDWTPPEQWTDSNLDEYEAWRTEQETEQRRQLEEDLFRSHRAVERLDPTRRIEELRQLAEEAEERGDDDLAQRYMQQISEAQAEQYSNAWQLWQGQVNIARQETYSREDIGRGAERSRQDIERQEARSIEDIWRQHFRSIEDLERQTARSREDIARNNARSMYDINLGAARQLEDLGINTLRSVEDLNIGVARSMEDLDRQFARSMEDRAWQLDKWASATDRVYSRFGHSSARIAQNLEDQNRRFEQWMNNLAELRSRGLSEDAIRILEADDPNNESQVRQLARASDEEIARINAQIARRVQMGVDAAPNVDRQGVARQRGRAEEDIGINFGRSMEDLARQTQRSTEDIRRNTARAMEDLARQTARALEDLNINAQRSLTDLNIGLQRQFTDLNINVDRQLTDLGINTDRQLEDLNISVARQMSDLEHSIVGGYADSREGALAIFDGFMAELESRVNSTGTNIGGSIARGLLAADKPDMSGPRDRSMTSKGAVAWGDRYAAQAQAYAYGGIALHPHVGLMGEAGNEAMVPLNSQGVSFLAQAIKASQSVFDGVLTSGQRDPVSTFGGGHGGNEQLMQQMLSVIQMQQAASTDSAPIFTGNMTVVANDPAEFERQQRHRTAFRRMTRTRGATG